ncbi:hypothetical protein D3C85_1521850 [compost metagenome]
MAAGVVGVTAIVNAHCVDPFVPHGWVDGSQGIALQNSGLRQCKGSVLVTLIIAKVQLGPFCADIEATFSRQFIRRCECRFI